MRTVGLAKAPATAALTLVTAASGVPFIHTLHCEHTTADAVLIERALRRGRLYVAFDRCGGETAFRQALDVERPELNVYGYTVPACGRPATRLIATQTIPAVLFIFAYRPIGEKNAIEFFATRN